MGMSTRAEHSRPRSGSRGTFTVDDYMKLEWPPGKRYELLDGELVSTPAPRRKHQDIVLDLGALLKAHVKGRGLGAVFIAPFDVVLSNVTVCQPDVLFVSAARGSIVTDANVQGAPDLAVEVLSTSGARDRVVKRRLYEEAGIAHYWLIDPDEKTIEEFVLEGGRYRQGACLDLKDAEFRPALFPDLAIGLEKLFA